MVGLDSEKFHQKLASKNHVKVNNKIYCSAISKTFILKKFASRGLDPKWICVLPHNSPMTVNVFNKAKAAMFKLRVTAIPANHCPGSVMFLFEAMQVWPLAHFFLRFLFVKTLGGQINDPSSGNTILYRSSQQLPRLRLGLLKGFLS